MRNKDSGDAVGEGEINYTITCFTLWHQTIHILLATDDRQPVNGERVLSSPSLFLIISESKTLIQNYSPIEVLRPTTFHTRSIIFDNNNNKKKSRHAFRNNTP